MLQEQEKSSVVGRNRRKPSNSKNQNHLQNQPPAVKNTEPTTPPAKSPTPPPVPSQNDQNQKEKQDSSSNANRKNRNRKSNPNFTGKNTSPTKAGDPNNTNVTIESLPTLNSTQRRRSRKAKPPNPTVPAQSGNSSGEDQLPLENPKTTATPRKPNHFRSESTPNKTRPVSNPELSTHLSTPSSENRSSLYSTTPSSTKSGFYAGAYFENSPAASALPIPSFSSRTKSPKLAQSFEEKNQELVENTNRISHYVPLTVNTGEKTFIPNPQGNPFWVPTTVTDSSSHNPESMPLNGGNKLHPSVSSPNLNTSLDPSMFTLLNLHAFPPVYPNLHEYPQSRYYSNPMPQKRCQENPIESLNEADFDLRKRSQDLLSFLGAYSAVESPLSKASMRNVNGVFSGDDMSRMMAIEQGAVLEQIGRNLKDMLKISG
ncbi:hypothetical protein HK098_004474 [Nowakowskiella sp. JEL0407]|nr:hypothetical protein HK098_004474 [Nowakowskiella sp. JEL0407]